MRRIIIIAATLATLAGCAEGSALMIGEARPPIADPESVQVLTEMPENAEQIAFVTATSDSGITAQGDLEFALAEIKKQAAKVGANAVVIRPPGTEDRVMSVNGQVYSGSAAVLSGTAIYVE